MHSPAGSPAQHTRRSSVRFCSSTMSAALVAFLGVTPVHAEAVVRVGWCARTVSAAATPFAVATKMGWFAQAGFRVELIPLPGSTDCVKSVATRDVGYSLPSVEPLAII